MFGANTGVYENGDGTWTAAIQYQDGVDRREYPTRGEAIRHVVRAHPVWNGVEITPDEVPVYRRMVRVVSEWVRES